MKFFNTLTRQKEEFLPLVPGKVGMYTCGPTVYNYAHIGNLRAFMFEDLLRRYLEYKGFEVTHVMNITDVEDKIIRTVRETGKSLQEFTEYYTQEFFRDLDTLNIKRAHLVPRATATIPGMIALIEKLIAKQHAYVADDGSVYFSLKSFPDYGKLSHRKLDEQVAGARVELRLVPQPRRPHHVAARVEEPLQCVCGPPEVLPLHHRTIHRRERDRKRTWLGTKD